MTEFDSDKIVNFDPNDPKLALTCQTDNPNQILNCDNFGPGNLHVSIESLDVSELRVDAREIVLTMNIERLELILDKMSDSMLKRLLDNCDEIRAIVEKRLLQRV